MRLFLFATIAASLVIFIMSPGAAEEIHVAAERGDVATVKALLRAGTPVDLPSTSDTSTLGVPPLFVAVKWNRIEVVKVLLDAGADPTKLPANHRISDTPMTMAARFGRIEILRLFLDRGADPNKMAHSGPPIHHARFMKNEEIENILLEAGAVTSFSQPSITHLIANADIDRGRRLARTCRVCHADPEDRETENTRVPRLWDIVGREKGRQPGVEVTDALENFGGVWTFNDLNSFLALPGAFIPGTEMGYIDLIDKEQNRVDIIAYLRTLSDDPVPLPE